MTKKCQGCEKELKLLKEELRDKGWVIHTAFYIKCDNPKCKEFGKIQGAGRWK